ncbi:MAG TPA: hypothetical protein VM600_09575, partial [Actinomycetota bacterium]|nr:hypothetical protein [Actinomycetota bacterium]
MMKRLRIRSSAAVVAVFLLAACGSDAATDRSATPGVPAVSPIASVPAAPSPNAGSPAAPEASSPAPSLTRAGVPAPKSTTTATPVEPGVYRYTQHGEMTFGAFRMPSQPEGTLDVGKPSGDRQTHVRRYSDDRSREQVVRFAGSRIELLEATERFGSGAAAQTIRCKLDEPLTIAELPMTVGRAWADNARCDGVEITLRSTVLR